MSASVLHTDARLLKGSVSIAHIIGETLALRRRGRLHIARCPFHQEKTPSFTVFDKHYHCFGCSAHGDVFDWLMQVHRITFSEAVAHLAGVTHRNAVVAAVRPLRPIDRPGEAERIELARRLWCDAADPRGTLVEAYLNRRGARLPDAPVIRFHPVCPRRDGALPAMVGLMTDPVTGGPSGVHRTFLMPDGSGKAKIDKPKMMLGKAGVIRLVEDEEIGVGLGLAEGIETALTVTQRIGWGPVWAATSAGAIRSFPVLRGTTLNIFADNDATGIAAARTCASRWAAAGLEVLIHAPPAGKDWADAAQRLAYE